MPVPDELPALMATTPGSTLFSTLRTLVVPAMAGAGVEAVPGAVVTSGVLRSTVLVSVPRVATAIPPPTRPPTRAATRATAKRVPPRPGVRSGVGGGAVTTGYGSATSHSCVGDGDGGGGGACCAVGSGSQA